MFAIVVAGGCYFLGGFGRLFSDRIDVAANGYDSIIPAMLETLSPLLIGIVIILVLSASMSTLSSLVMASSSTLTLDFIREIFDRKMNTKKQLLIMRGLIVVFVAISVVIAIIQYQSRVTFIAQLMSISWGALAGCFLGPFLYGLYWKKVSKISVWACFIFSTGFMAGNILFGHLYPPILQSPINAGAVAILSSLIIVPVVSLFTKSPGEKQVNEMFSCYEERVTVSAKKSLGE